MTIFVCEDSLDGILTAVYDAWDSRLGHSRVRLRTEAEDTYELFCEYRQVETDLDKAERVLRTVRQRMGEEAREAVCYACACPHPDKADAVYRLIVRGLSMEDGTGAIHYLQDPSIALVMKLRQKAWHEAHRMLGFLRFEELPGGILYAQMEPPCAVLPLIAPHFADRLRQENWIIRDRKRGLLAVHRKDSWWILTEDRQLNQELLSARTEGEKEFRALWKAFCETIAIEERRNPRCQQNLLPYRFRPYMNEFESTEKNTKKGR